MTGDPTTVWTATGHDAELGDLVFASLDGVGFLQVTETPTTAEDVATIRNYVDGDGNFRPMLLHRDLIANRFGGEFVTVEIEEAA